MTTPPPINPTRYRRISTAHTTVPEELEQLFIAGAGAPAVADEALATWWHARIARKPALPPRGWLLDMAVASAAVERVPVEGVFCSAMLMVSEKLEGPDAGNAFNLVIVGTPEQTAATLAAAERLAVTMLGLDLPIFSPTLMFDAFIRGLEELPLKDQVMVTEVLASERGVGFGDQVEAAGNAARRNCESLIGTGQKTQPTRSDDVPSWARLGALDALTGWTRGTCRTCVCAPSPHKPQPVVASAWRPGLVTCAQCVFLMDTGLSDIEDATCDGCGHVCSGPEAGDGIYRSAINIGPLTYLVGLCERCALDWPAKAAS